jgi:hypothetical protein
MPRCPNCSHSLVLLSNRLKYKCALCSKLYPKKEIDNKEFRKWNKSQKELDIKNYEQEKKNKLIHSRELRKSIKSLFRNSKEVLKQKGKEWILKNRDKYNEIKRNYWNRNVEQLNSKRRERYKLKSKQLINYQKQWEQNNQYKHNLKRRLADLRERQKQFALQFCKNQQHKLCTAKFQDFLPTFYFPNY